MSPPPTNQPTNQGPTDEMPVPEFYLSSRVTIAHDKVGDVKNVFHDYEYIIYPHTGGVTGKQHFHVYVPLESSDDATAKRHTERIRKRFRDGLGLSGNGNFSIKRYDNGLLKGIQYGSKEGTDPIVSNDRMSDYVKRAPAWVDKAPTQATLEHHGFDTKTKKDTVLTYNNIVYLAVCESRMFKKPDWSFKDALKHYMDRVNCTFSYGLATHGVPEAYFNEYLTRIGKRKRDMDWMDFRG